MQKSESINELATALSIAQGQIKPATKDADNPYFKSKYADLAAIWEACREPLSKNALSISQFVESEAEYVTVTTMLLHKSGQWLSSALSLKPVKNDPQGYGSAATYGRRYGLSAIVGIVADIDDDGNAATFGAKAVQRKAGRQESQGAKKEFIAAYYADIEYSSDTDELDIALVSHDIEYQRVLSTYTPETREMVIAETEKRIAAKRKELDANT